MCASRIYQVLGYVFYAKSLTRLIAFQIIHVFMNKIKHTRIMYLEHKQEKWNYNL